MSIPLLEKIPINPEILNPDPGFIAHSVPPPASDERADPHGGGIREMHAGEEMQVAQSLAESFGDRKRPDPQFAAILRREDTRIQKLGHGFLDFIERDYSPNGVIHVPDKLFGAAVWMPPNEWKTDLRTQAVIARSLFGVASPLDLARLGTALTYAETWHKKAEKVIGPHYYLAVLGVAPYYQGRGYGEALIQRMLDRCDQEGMPAYLEASSLRSVPLYRRKGFITLNKGQFPGGIEPIHFMFREPQE